MEGGGGSVPLKRRARVLFVCFWVVCVCGFGGFVFGLFVGGGFCVFGGVGGGGGGVLVWGGVVCVCLRGTESPLTIVESFPSIVIQLRNPPTWQRNEALDR